MHRLQVADRGHFRTEGAGGEEDHAVIAVYQDHRAEIRIVIGQTARLPVRAFEVTADEGIVLSQRAQGADRAAHALVQRPRHQFGLLDQIVLGGTLALFAHATSR